MRSGFGRAPGSRSAPGRTQLGEELGGLFSILPLPSAAGLALCSALVQPKPPSPAQFVLMQLPAPPGEEIAAGKGLNRNAVRAQLLVSLCGHGKMQAGSSTRFNNITKMQRAPLHNFSGTTVLFRVLGMNPDQHLPFSFHRTPLPSPWVKQYWTGPGCIPLTGTWRTPDSIPSAGSGSPQPFPPQTQEMLPAPARVPDVSGGCRYWAPLGFWPSVMP